VWRLVQVSRRQAPDAVPPRTTSTASRYRWVVLFTVLFGLFTYGTITTVISASLKTVADDLDTSTNALAWAITGPFLALGVGNPIFGKIGDIHGRRRFFVLGMAVFTAASLGCALAPSAGWLIALRAVAGLGASAATPNGTALVLDAFSIEERPRALGWFNLFGVGAPAIGLALGGLMVDALGWRAVFWVYGGISVVATLVAVVVVRDSTPSERVPIDVAGAATLAVATIGVALGLTLGASRGFGDAAVLALLALGPLGIAAFVSVERRTPHPLAPLHYFRDANFSVPLFGYFAGHITYMGGFVITPILLRDSFGYREAAVSAVLLARPLSFSLTSPVGGAVAARAGERRASVIGSLPLVIGALLFAGGALSGSIVPILCGLVLSGIGLGLVTPPYMSGLTGSVRAGELGLASGLLQMSASLGTVVGIQLAMLLLGDAKPHAGSDFVLPYLVGGACAAVMLGLSAAMRARPAPVLGDALVTDLAVDAAAASATAR
jgi:MFS family permease